LANDPDSSQLTEELFRSVTTTRSRAANERINSLGPIRSFTFAGAETLDGRMVYRYVAETANRIFLWRFALDDDGKISVMTLEEEE
jgi:hypothetical protein